MELAISLLTRKSTIALPEYPFIENTLSRRSRLMSRLLPDRQWTLSLRKLTSCLLLQFVKPMRLSNRNSSESSLGLSMYHKSVSDIHTDDPLEEEEEAAVNTADRSTNKNINRPTSLILAEERAAALARDIEHEQEVLRQYLAHRKSTVRSEDSHP